MGIIFFCQNCDDRLNVKSHQAGQQGVCPSCGGDIHVPQVSVAEAEQIKNLKRAPTESTSHSITMDQTEFDQIGADEIGAEQFGNPPPQRNSPVSAGKNANRKKTTPPPSPDSDSFLLGKPELSSLGASAEEVIRSGLKRVWYVRHPRDGETGPVKGNKIRAMLSENKISIGCMIWRDDWDNWDPAELAFPDLIEQLTAAAENNARSSPGRNQSLKARFDHAKKGKDKSRGRKSPAKQKQQTIKVVAIVAGIVTIIALALLLIRIF